MNKVVINGKSYEVPNGNISIIGNKIYVDGKEFTEEMEKDSKIVDVIVYGNVSKIDCQGSVEVKGNAENINCGGSCSVNKDVAGDVSAGGSVRCNNVKGTVRAGGTVKCKSIRNIW